MDAETSYFGETKRVRTKPAVLPTAMTAMTSHLYRLIAAIERAICSPIPPPCVGGGDDGAPPHCGIGA